jgi:hypothetical protein
MLPSFVVLAQMVQAPCQIHSTTETYRASEFFLEIKEVRRVRHDGGGMGSGETCGEWRAVLDVHNGRRDVRRTTGISLGRAALRWSRSILPSRLTTTTTISLIDNLGTAWNKYTQTSGTA